MSNEIIPRRIRLDMMTPEELTIFNMLDKIEKLGAHPLLTDVIVLLNEAREKLADWVDLQAVAKPEYCPTCGMYTAPTCTRCGHVF